MSKLKLWEYDNKIHLINIFNIIVNNLEKKNLFINDKQEFYNDFIRLFYYNFELI